jgi:pimeloyl-ACP methyl ester carboxylesterase
VHVPDPLSASDVIVEALAAQFGPAWRVLSIKPRDRQPYQVQAADVRATIEQFGFSEPVLLGERLGCVAALLVAAWHPELISRLVLVDPIYAAPPEYESTLEARALRDCPPDIPTLRKSVRCPVLVLPWNDAALKHLQTFLQIP